MPDDAQLARIEERLEMFRKHIVEQLADHEDEDARRFQEIAETIRAEFAAFERLMRGALDSVVKIHDAKADTLQAKLDAQAAAADAKVSLTDAKNIPYRVGLGIVCGAILTGLVALLFSAIMATHPLRMVPELPPPHSTREQKER